jgi:acyl-CoA thioesterase-1
MSFLEKNGLKIFLFLILFLPYSITAETKKLLILGDSISAGYGIKESKNWVTLLEKKLNADNENTYILVNASISGDTSSGGVSRIEKALNTHSPDFVLIELGGNDALRGYPIININQNIDQIINIVLRKNSKPILMQIKIPPNYGKKYVEAFENIYKNISSKYEIPLIDFILENVALKKSLMQFDGIHPNEMAQPIMAEQIKSSLIKIIK